MGVRKRYKLSLYILIPFIVAGLALFSFCLAYRIGQASKALSFGSITLFLLAILAAAGALGFLVARMVLRPMENFAREAEKSIGGKEPAPDRKENILEADEIDRFERAVIDVMDALPAAEAQKRFPEIVGESRALRAALKRCLLAAPSDTTVIITGESGTGKELIASALHRLSGREKGPFVAVNCVAIPEGLLESELFGHEKGSFTGAVSQKKGKFEAARGGTLFLDEIGDMAPATQAKILRVLQEREFERVGGNRPLRADVRVVAATNQDLREKVKAGAFREDLYHRVKVFDIDVPPLRRRREDILPLARHFLGEGKGWSTGIAPGAENALVAYDWPGNVRELRNTLERAVLLAEGGAIDVEHLPSEIQANRMERYDAGKEGTLDGKLDDIEKGLILDALKQVGGVQARAAEKLGISQRSLWHRIKKLNIDVKLYRP